MSETITIPWWNLDLGDAAIEQVTAAMRARQVSQGVLTARFEQALAERLGIAHAVCTNSGTAALTLAMMACGIGPGDELVMPNRTWVATANAALILGATVRPVDSRPGTMLIDADRIEAAIGPATRALVPVSLNGAALDMERINAIAARHGLSVIEDSCQSLFSQSRDGRCLGTKARFGCFSLGMAKSLTTGAGGVVVCADADDARLLRRIRNQGMSEYDLSERHGVRAWNFKFTDLQAAVGLAQLPRLEARIANQRDLHRLYRDGLAGIGCLRLLPVDVDAGEVPLRAEVLCSERSAFMAALAEQGIGTCAQTPNLADYPFIGADPARFPLSRAYGDGNLVLPSGPDQPLDNARRTVETIRRLAGRFKDL
jgi:perosamine synthetase